MIIRKENKPEFLINKIALRDYARIKGRMIGGTIECAILGDHRVPVEQRLSWAFDELDTAVRWGSNGLTFPNSSETVRQWGIRTTVQNSRMLEWAIGPGSNVLNGALRDRAYVLLDALVIQDRSQGERIGEKILGPSFKEWREAIKRHNRELGARKGYSSL